MSCVYSTCRELIVSVMAVGGGGRRRVRGRERGGGGLHVSVGGYSAPGHEI